MKYQSCDHCCTRIEGITVRYGSKTVLDNVNLHINCRELLAIVGPNGAGKTTLLKALLGEIKYEGKQEFRLMGKPARPTIGYVPQKVVLDPETPVSVLDLFAAAVAGRPCWLSIGKRIRKTAAEALEMVTAGNLIRRRLCDLSGGELQRVLLALAISPVPNLLLLDEAMAAVDVGGISLFYDVINRLKKIHDISIILVTHDIAGVAQYADRMVLLDRKVVADGDPAEILSDERLLQSFGPALWNISKIPGGQGRTAVRPYKEID
ncbi:MAG: metal ABC transporter ATP-binding protein [Candidatus Wallbacteria bacterium]|nr:metal ABC transporter ATP-binding protein [Candidatus Wallbacteria bacterium]